ncbi:MAG: hypothetical protein ACR2PA_08975 [Hyphomicrobiaceae bacterium]
MASAGLNGPYRLCVEGIDLAIRKRSAGVFALGSIDAGGRFCLNRIGRTDDDLRPVLRNFIGSDVLFKYIFTDDNQAAFLKECELFHNFKPSGNFFHPVRPRGTKWSCPICHQSDSLD